MFWLLFHIQLLRSWGAIILYIPVFHTGLFMFNPWRDCEICLFKTLKLLLLSYLLSYEQKLFYNFSIHSFLYLRIACFIPSYSRNFALSLYRFPGLLAFIHVLLLPPQFVYLFPLQSGNTNNHIISKTFPDHLLGYFLLGFEDSFLSSFLFSLLNEFFCSRHGYFSSFI